MSRIKNFILAGCLAMVAAVVAWNWFASSPVQTRALYQVSWSWVRFGDDPSHAYLCSGNTVVGGWDYGNESYRDYDPVAQKWGKEQAKAPFAPPAIDPDLLRRLRDEANKDGKKRPVTPIGGQLEPWQLNGVKMDELCKHERYTVNGEAVGQKKSIQMLKDSVGDLGDDSAKLWLVVRSKDAQKREAFLTRLYAHPIAGTWAKDKWRVWAGPASSPEHYLMRDRETGATRFPVLDQAADPVCYLMLADGTELWHDEKCDGATIDKLLRADPAYAPDKSPGPAQPSPMNPFAGMPQIPPVMVVMLIGAGLGMLVLSKPTPRKVPK